MPSTAKTRIATMPMTTQLMAVGQEVGGPEEPPAEDVLVEQVGDEQRDQDRNGTAASRITLFSTTRQKLGSANSRW